MVDNNIIEVLRQNIVRNSSLINFLESYKMDYVFINGKSVLVCGVSDLKWTYISSTSTIEFEALVQNLTEQDKCFAVIEEWMIPYLASENEIIWKMSCMRLFLPDEKNLPKINSQVKMLKMEDAEFIYKNYNYQEVSSVDYISERIKNGIGLGIYKYERLVAWVFTHDDGAIGGLHVLEEHRGKGYAKELVIAMIEKLRSIGKLPFVHIEESNHASMALVRKIGFEEDKIVSWLERR